MHLLSLGAPYNQIYHFIQIEHFVKKTNKQKIIKKHSGPGYHLKYLIIMLIHHLS